MPQVAVDLIANTKDVSREINRTIREVSLLGQAIDTSNDIAVQTWRNAASAAKDYLNVSNATYEQQLKLDGAMRRTEERMARHAGATAASTRSMSGFDAMVAEASEHLGEHSLALGRVEFALSGFADRALGVDHVVGLLGASLGRFALGSIEITAILAGIDAVVAVYDHFTSAAREATKAEDDLIKKLEEAERVKLGGGVEGLTATAADDKVKKLTEDRDKLLAMAARDNAPGQLSGGFLGGGFTSRANANKAQLDKASDDLKIAISERDAIYKKNHEAQNRALTSDLSALISHNHATVEERRTALTLLRADQEELTKLASSDVAGRASLAGEIDKLSSALFPKVTSEKGLQGAELAQLHDAVRLGNAAIAALNKRMTDDEKALHDLDVGKLHLAETRAAAMDVSSPQGAFSELEVIKTKHDLRIKEIDQMNIDNDLKRALKKQADDEEVAAVEALDRRLRALADKRDEEDRKQDEHAAAKKKQAIEREARILESVETKMANDLLDTRLAFGHRLLKAALEPEIAFLHGKAISQFEQSAADFLVGDVGGGAAHAAAGLALETGAGLVGSIAGGGGSGGGSGGGGGGFGSGGHAGALLGAHGTSDRMLKIEIVNITRDQTGREVARTRQMIQRLDDQNMPVRVTL